MPANWVTHDKFSELTGVHTDFILRKCRKGEWPEGTAWSRLSDRIYLISIEWWDNKWHEMGRALKQQAKAASKSNFNTTVNDAENASPKSPRLPTLDD